MTFQFKILFDVVHFAHNTNFILCNIDQLCNIDYWLIWNIKKILIEYILYARQLYCLTLLVRPTKLLTITIKMEKI